MAVASIQGNDMADGHDRPVLSGRLSAGASLGRLDLPAIQRSRRSVVTAVLLAAIAAYLGTRLWGLNRMVNTDEVDWLGGAANVFTGVAHGNLGATYQLPHPGLPILWSGVVAFILRIPDYPQLHPGDVPYHLVHQDLRRLGADPLEMLTTARLVKILAQGLLFAWAAWLTLRLFSLWTGALAIFFLVAEPFLIGNDRFLHIDGMVSIASFSALLTIVEASRGSTARWMWVLAGSLAAVAWLTRFTAGVLLPVAAVVLVVSSIAAVRTGRHSAGEAWRTARSSFLSFCVAAGVVTLVLWPALIVDPVRVLSEMWGYVSNAVTVGHELPMFYNGKIVSGDPGWLYYPDALLWRTTPTVTIGVVVLVIGALFARRTFLPGTIAPALGSLLLFALLYAVLMDLGAKKFDRYILPVFPVLDVAAAVGWAGLARLLWRARRRSGQVMATTVVAIVLIAQFGAAWSDRHYGFDYYNALRGGTGHAQDHMQLGWGEGLDQAASFILSQPDGSTATIRSANNQVTLLYFMPETARVLNSGIGVDARGLDDWATTDYYVSYLAQWERNLNSVIQDQAARYTPLHTVSIHGVAYARVYDLRTIPPPPSVVASLPCQWDYSGQATLLTYRDRSIKAHPEDPNLRELTLHFTTRITKAHQVRVRLVPKTAEEGRVPITVDAALMPAAADGAVSSTSLQFTIPRGLTTDSYWIDVSVLDPATGDPIMTRLLGSDTSRREAASANMCADAGAVN